MLAAEEAQTDAAELTDTSGSTDGSVETASITNNNNNGNDSSDSKKSTDVWVQVCEEEAQYSGYTSVDTAMTTDTAPEVLSQKIASASFTASDRTTPSTTQTQEGECSVPAQDEHDENSTILNSDCHSFQQAPNNSNNNGEARISSVTFHVPETAHHQTSSELFLNPPDKNNKSGSSHEIMTPSEPSQRDNNNKKQEARISSVTFHAPSETPESSSDFLMAPSGSSNSQEMTSSERWRDDTKVQGLPTVSRKISVVQNNNNNHNHKVGDFGPPTIPSRTSFHSAHSRVSSSVAVKKRPQKSILKASVEEEIFVKLHRRHWKKLPPPDMDHIKMMRQQVLDSLLQQEQQQQQSPQSPQEKQEEEKEEEEGATVPLIIPPTTFVQRSQSDGANMQMQTSHQHAPLTTLLERSKSEGAKLNVKFEQIIIRQYQQTIGDNPSVSYGTPISLDWAYMENDPLDFDVYEASKTRRRTMRQMFLNHYQRKNLLIHRYGHSVQEVKAAKRATNRIKNQREFSKIMQTSLQPLLVFEEMRESAVRKAKRRMSNNGNGNGSNNRWEGSSIGSREVSMAAA